MCPGTNYQSILDECTEEEARGDMARAMRDVDPVELNEARNRDRDVREHVQAISDQRAYGSGCDFDRRGNRDLETGDDQRKVRSGAYQNTNTSPAYPVAKSAHAHVPRDDKLPGGWPHSPPASPKSRD
jgi:hypothetical protein